MLLHKYQMSCNSTALKHLVVIGVMKHYCLHKSLCVCAYAHICTSENCWSSAKNCDEDKFECGTNSGDAGGVILRTKLKRVMVFFSVNHARRDKLQPKMGTARTLPSIALFLIQHLHASKRKEIAFLLSGLLSRGKICN